MLITSRRPVNALRLVLAPDIVIVQSSDLRRSSSLRELPLVAFHTFDFEEGSNESFRFVISLHLIW